MSYPILFTKSATDFTGLGIGMLTDAEKCTYTEELNGSLELTMVYPVDGVLFSSIEKESIIAIKMPDRANYQGFRVFSISKPINKKVTIQAEHVSYRLAEIPLRPFRGTGGINMVLKAFEYGNPNNGQQAVIAHPFTFHTNFQNVPSMSFKFNVPESIRYAMGDSEEMMLDKKKHEAWKNGEWLFDNYDISFLQNRGVDRSNTVVFEYGNNLRDFTQDENLTNTVTGVFPYWHTEMSDGTPKDVLGSICYATGHEQFANERIVAVNVDEFFTDEEKAEWPKDSDGTQMPTVANVNSKASKALADMDDVCKPKLTYTIDPVDLRKVSGYEEFAGLITQCNLGDTIGIYFKDYEINTTQKIIKVQYNVLADSVTTLSVGDPTPNLASTIADITNAIEANRAGIIINKDSLLLYVNNKTGALGTQIYMDEDDIKLKAAGNTTGWNMVPITGNPSTTGGEGWTIELYNYGNPTSITTKVWNNATQQFQVINKYDNSTGAYNGYKYFDQDTGAVWQAANNTWTRAKWTRQHAIRDHSGAIGADAYADRLETYTTAELKITSDAITSEVSRASGAEGGLSSRIAQTASSISLSLSNDTVDKTSGPSITLSWNKEGGGQGGTMTTGQIKLNGQVVFTNDLSSTGSTIIDGGRIQTGTISANRIDVDNLVAKKLSTTNDSNGSHLYAQVGQIAWFNGSGEDFNSNYIGGIYNYYGNQGYTPKSGQSYTVQGSHMEITVKRPGGGGTGLSILNSSTSGTSGCYVGLPTYGSKIVTRSDIDDLDADSITLGGVRRTSWPSSPSLPEWVYNVSGTTYGGDEYISSQDIVAHWVTASSVNADLIEFMNSTSHLDCAATADYVNEKVSDARLKDDVTSLNNINEFYMSLKPVSFIFKEDIYKDPQSIGKTRYGFLAQEVQTSLYSNGMGNAWMVYERESKPNSNHYKYALKYLNIEFDDFHAFHVAMIQKHEREIQELKDEITNLKDTIKELVNLLQNKED